MNFMLSLLLLMENSTLFSQETATHFIKNEAKGQFISATFNTKHVILHIGYGQCNQLSELDGIYAANTKQYTIKVIALSQLAVAPNLFVCNWLITGLKNARRFLALSD